MQQLDDRLYRIEVSLPESPLGSVNSYVIVGDNRTLMIDTGFNSDECRKTLDNALDELEIDRERLDIFATHLHADHTGLAPYLAGVDSNLYLNEYGVKVLTADTWDKAYEYASKNGFPKEELDTLFEMHPGKKFTGSNIPELTSLADGRELSIGEYSLQVVNTPGHTLGHQCLYDSRKKILFSGDHVLGDITPNISVHTYETRYVLVHYLQSLRKTAKLDVERIFPGHRSSFENLHERIQELEEHHAIRAAEVLEILTEKPQNAYEVALEMDWDIPLADWDNFPVVQRWFATGEALSHLWYLESENKVTTIDSNEYTRFAVKS